ncbi:MAG: suppressor of fused domain protein [Candidatus Hydrogenedentes bacterium]|nr:suppressor of fused domain protein [Candidatus Hydrogenedentota bacterium]
MLSLVEHYEKYLGPIEHGWNGSADTTEMPFQVVECRGGTFEGVSAFATLGMSRNELRSATSRKVIRQELLLAAPTDFGPRNIPGLLQQIAAEAIARGLAYLRGDIVGPRGFLFERKAFEAVYVTMPVYFPEPLKTCRSDEGYDIVIAWLVPITRREALYVREHGWEKFEKLLEQEDPNLCDFDRASLC